jgi:hypothetical protein
MAPRKALKPATERTVSGLREDSQAGELDKTPDSELKTEPQAPGIGQLIDRYGHVHSEAVLTNWSPQALKALGVHRVGDEPKDGEQ